MSIPSRSGSSLRVKRLPVPKLAKGWSLLTWDFNNWWTLQTSF